ncbi:MAG: radical SAM protein [Actinobacteria bacterium]|nr:MAG: radical SAM protein [Actinomycetota bacterium]
MQYPAYLNLSDEEFEERIAKAYAVLEDCEVCPRHCHINRRKGEFGYCGTLEDPSVTSHHPHFGEEPPLVGRYGSGTIFMASCNLACVYCQNYEISQMCAGETVTVEQFAGMMLELQARRCHNVNIVTPSIWVPQIIKGVYEARKGGLRVPLVYNTSSYDELRSLKLLDGIADIYMPDAKYASEKLARKYSLVSHYPSIMKAAIKEMHRQVGDLVVEDGVAKRGLLVRHLVLPKDIAGSEEILDWLKEEISANTLVNVMEQYTPYWKAQRYPEIARPVASEEYLRAVEHARALGLRILNRFSTAP